ncbi:MAG: hypothetical protein AUJ92_10710 [Armatimonadetes bacterium CG2_30_59_28]|nr:MAG: hypothetical protein AUJ92_10710 [Armatimonadetes bacterium CG2_30_59_28]PIU64428.1 MAG: sulfatase [Armatimonadetes bacterium CG07_land_8_20_14_0_80_59_28]PIX45652.1 MAG: sulfatase [Armatimonadetes bacterium CG_4_8_14_3_um_filter_58_9]PIY41007.1 MAG: sulfatase [Armatimonadetes bacterium CG_4_10_14_3_um_filter_59_10]
MQQKRSHSTFARQPNILFVFADQLRGCSLGHVGQEPVLTPNIDRFAAEGLRFTRAVANAPVCCPMRATLLTGLHPLSHGVMTNDVRLREDVITIADVLRDNGYHTAYIGKWHLDGSDRGCFTPPGPRRHGFEHWAASNCNHNYFESFYYRDSPEPIWIDGYEPTAQTDLAMDYLSDTTRRDKPFCLFLSWGPPHCPYDHVPTRFRELYDADTMPLRPNVVNPNRENIAGYYAHTSALDWNFGRLMKAVDDLGLRDDTLVVFTSDHGDMLYSQNRGWKCKPWHESVIVPFISRWPGRVPTGATASAPFGLVDVMPTLLNLCGAPVPNEVEGTDLSHLLLGQPGFRPTSQIIHHHLCPNIFSFREWRGVVTETHTYARFREKPWVFYDDVADPYQLRNQTDDADCHNLQRAIEADLNDWQEQLNDPFETGAQLARRYALELDERGIYPCYYQPEIQEGIRRRAANREERRLLA